MAISSAETDANKPGYDAAETNLGKIASTVCSFLLIVCLPTLFWMSLIELAANYIAPLGMAMTTRLIIASVLVGLLSIIWRFIVQPAGGPSRPADT
jgi:uncharacterized membrane protein YedE/YeeE